MSATKCTIPAEGNASTEDIELLSIKSKDGLCSSVSPFCTKMEAWLRFHGFRYTTRVSVFDFNKVPFGRLPTIIHDGQMIPDSSFIIRYLKNTFPDKIPKLTAEQEALSTMVTFFVEKHWGQQLVYQRFLDEKGWPAFRRVMFGDLPAVVQPIVSRLIRARNHKGLNLNGLAQFHPKDQLLQFESATSALSTMLADKKYFTGDVPTEGDASVFGFLDNILYDEEIPDLADIVRKYPNLVDHTRRIRQKYFQKDC